MAGYLSREEQQFRETSPFIPGSIHLLLNSEKTVSTISISSSQKGKKGGKQGKEWNLTSLIIREKMGKFFGGAGDPTTLPTRTKTMLEVSKHA